MDLSDEDRRLLAALEAGLEAVPRPYAALGRRAGLSEEETIARLKRLVADGVVRRLGIVVRHHELGYGANAMVVWDVPDELLEEAGVRLAALSFVTLCYSRPRRLPEWRYNLFTMIHGRDREVVRAAVEEAARAAALTDIAREVLFSRRRFKQEGARYFPTEAAA
ncbi:MAG: AsnC family transcriptional regulator [Rhodospirillales bacterium]|nr:AsnC family transcriptional regulator [Rhodospirillales bacterium]